MVRSHFKHNKLQTLEVITPQFYFEDDISISGLTIKIEDTLVNTHLVVANNISSILNVSATTNFSSINTLSGIAPYFVKQNKLTNLTPFQFETDILVPLGYDFSDFATSADFGQYLSGTLLPSIRLNSPTALTHEYLISKLGWFYFLNTSGSPYSPSTYVSNKLIDLYFGKSLALNEGIKGLETFLWNNYGTCSVLQNLGVIPANYVSGITTWTSGTQQLDKLNTLVDVVYSPLLIDDEDTYVKDAFDDYISSRALLNNTESNGAFNKLLKAISYFIHDIDNEIETLRRLYDLEKCPDEYLPLIAELIGWNLYGYDPNRWRLQLRNATSIYKAKGTKRAIQLAIDSIFSESFFNVSGQINELYESYIPDLVYYSLATESSILQSFDTWTRQLAESLGINDYSTQSMDTNIRFVVDYILLSVVKNYPTLFKLGQTQWNINDPNFIFNYRDRNFNIPPFEDKKWYKDTQLTESVIDFIVGKVACFGVSSSFITDLSNFIKDHTIDSEDLLELDNRWLFFYNGLKLPPNYNSILTNLSQDKLDYISIWSGKSSHFNLNLYASSFVYDQRSLTTSSTLVLQEALRAVNDFAPAHAIPDINLLLTDTDYGDYDEESGEFIELDIFDLPTTSSFVPGFFSSGTNMSSLSKAFFRTDVDNVFDLAFSSLSSLTNLPRNSLRRRSLHNVLPKENFYSRTGFNMPMINVPSSVEYSLANSLGFLPLGYIPSAARYVSVPNISSIPQIYDKCENLYSSSVYSGIAVSNTYPIRGYNALIFSSFLNYANRGNTNPIFGLISKILYNREKTRWLDYLNTSAGWAAYGPSAYYLDVSTSLANQNYNLSSFNNYEDFSFGDAHKIYKDWVTYFGRQNINLVSLDLSGGKDIFSHTYGPLVYNAKFDQLGSALNISSNLITSSFDSPVLINNGSGTGILSFAGSTIGTFVVSTGLVVRNEFRNRDILNKVEIVGTSGASQYNQFVIFNLAQSESSSDTTNYFVRNPIVKAKTKNGFPRLIYHFSSVGNILIPEHDFKLNLRYFNGYETGKSYGGATVGVWIHTEPTNNIIWSWTPNSKWEPYTLASSLTVNALAPFFHTKGDLLTNVSQDNLTSTVVGCYDAVTGKSTLLDLEHIDSSLFNSFEINFNTSNYNIIIPTEYYSVSGQVHTQNQNYVIEIFKLPHPDTNSYTLFDELNLIDLTENSRALEYNPKDLLVALNYMKDISNNKASRLATITSGTYFTSGGSRINYRMHPDWGTVAKNSNSALSSLEFIN